MTYRIVPRTEIGLPPTVTSSSGWPRPPLSNEPWITAHYTGVNVDYTGKATADVVHQIQRVFEDTKPFEYNYVIGQDDDNEIVEFAGKFRAAHSGGENDDAFGVLFLLGVGEDPTPLMIDKWRWLRDVLIFDGSLRPDVDQRMHYQMPDARTSCPGNIVKFWPEFLKPWVAPELPHVPVEVEDMSNALLWRPAGFANVFLVGAGPARNITPAEFKLRSAAGVPTLFESVPHPGALRSVLFQSGMTKAELTRI